MAINNVDMQDYEGNSYWTMANPDSISEFTKACLLYTSPSPRD